jgi:D-arabinose 5-phosphate isomerase GutQ
MQTPTPPEALTAATASSEIAAVTSNTASKLASLSSNVATPALQQAASLGPLSPVISTGIQFFGIALAGAVLYKGFDLMTGGAISGKKPKIPFVT